MTQAFASWPAIPGTDALRPLRTSLPWGKPLITIDGFDPMLQIVTANRISGDTVTGSSNWAASFVGYGSDTDLGPALAFSSTRARNSQTPTSVSSGDNFGAMRFYGADGYNFVQGAAFLAESDGTPSSNSMPGRLTFLTTSSGSGSAPIEALRIDSAGRTIVGGGAAQALVAYTPKLEVVAASPAVASLGLAAYGAVAVPSFEFFRSRGAAIGTNSAVQIGDVCGQIYFTGADGGGVGSTFAALVVIAELTASSASTPGRMTFHTTPSGSGNPTEVLRFDASQRATFGSTGSTSGAKVQVNADSSSQPIIDLMMAGAHATGGTLNLRKTRGAVPSTLTAVAAFDVLGALNFYGADGFNHILGGQVQVFTDATPTSGSLSSSMNFLVASSGSGSTTYERLRISGSGVVVINNNISNISGIWNFNVRTAQAGIINAGYEYHVNDAGGVAHYYVKSRNPANSVGLVNSGDNIASHNYVAGDGFSWLQAAYIATYIDGTASSNSMPGRLSFATTPSGTGVAVERLRIDRNGVIVTGANAAQADAVTTSILEILGTGLAGSAATVGRWSADASGANLSLIKNRNATVGSNTALSSGDIIGSLNFQGSSAIGFAQCAQVSGLADAAQTSGSAPGRLSFSTTLSGSTTLTERLRIDSSGRVIIGASADVFGVALQVLGTGGATSEINATRFSNDGVNPARLTLAKSRNTTIGSHTALSSGDWVGELMFRPDDGFSFTGDCAKVRGEMDLLATSGSVPGRLIFATTSSGAITAIERMRIDSSGRMWVQAGVAAATTTPTGNSNATVAGLADTNTFYCFGAFGVGNSASGAGIQFTKTRHATDPNSKTALSSGDTIGILDFYGANAITYGRAVAISAIADAAFSSNSAPGQLSFATSSSGSITLVERLRIDRTGAIFMPSVGTSASAANAFINNASTPVNQLLRSTSSIRYKKDVSAVVPSRIAAVQKIRPVEFTSTATADSGDETRFIGFIAEDVAKADRALVFLDSEGRPDGVMYDRVLLMQVEALRLRVEELERKQTRH